MIKRILFIAATLFSQQLMAQLPEDALRLTWVTPGGTARNMSIGGAMGSLGGDITAAHVNPAGIGLFRTGEAVLSPAFNLLKNKSEYRGGLNSDDRNRFAMGASGFIFGAQNYGRSRWTSQALSLSVNQTANFNRSTYYSGQNNFSSFAEKYLEELSRDNASVNSALNDTRYAFGSGLAVYTYLVDTMTLGGIKQWINLSSFAPNLVQKNRVDESGGITEFALTYAVNRDDKLYLGFSGAMPLLRYTKNVTYREEDASANVLNRFKYFEYREKVRTTGLGLNLKAGLIYKPVEHVRLGLALHSPTFMGLTDTYSSELDTDTENYGGFVSRKSSEQNGGIDGESKYFLVTPWRAMVSASYVFREVENVKRQRAFLTADLEYINFKANSYSAGDDNISGSNDYYKAVNRTIDSEYKGTFNVRVGGEIKFNTIMARLGFARYGNPYKDKALKASRTQFSGGLGYRNKGIFVDLSYVYSLNRDVSFPYRLEDKANTFATVNGTGGNVNLTVGFKLY